MSHESVVFDRLAMLKEECGQLEERYCQIHREVQEITESLVKRYEVAGDKEAFRKLVLAMPETVSRAFMLDRFKQRFPEERIGR